MENQEQKPVPETSITLEQPTKKQKPKWIVPAIIIAGIIVLGVGAWAGYNYWLKPVVPEKQPAEEQQEEEPDEFADWETHKNEEYGFELKYPHNYDFIDYALQSPRDVSPTELSFGLSVYSIHTSIIADGPCGTIYSGSFQEQKQIFDEANLDSDFDEGFRKTSAMINHSKVFRNKEGVKIVHGISSC